MTCDLKQQILWLILNNQKATASLRRHSEKHITEVLISQGFASTLVSWVVWYKLTFNMNVNVLMYRTQHANCVYVSMQINIAFNSEHSLPQSAAQTDES